MQDRDTLHRFLFESTSIRGELVHLAAACRAVLERHPYPPAVQALLGQALAAAALLASTVKRPGVLTLQLHGSGPLTLLVVQCTGARTLRGLARWHGEVGRGSLASQFGAGHLVITIDPGSGERYQGVVDLKGENLAAALETYFRQSEQLPTRLWLAADAQGAAGLLLQQLPDGLVEAELWQQVITLAATVRDEELLELGTRALLRRLYREVDVRLFEPEPVSFRCTCSLERIESVLLSLGRPDVDASMAEAGKVVVHCEFCNHRYELDAVDVERIFAGSVPAPGSSTRH